MPSFNFLNSIQLSSVKNISLNFNSLKNFGSEIIHYAQTGYSYFSDWMQPETTSFFMKARDDKNFMAHSMWCDAHKHQMKKIYNLILQSVQTNMPISHEFLEAELIAQQSTFNSKNTSALFYNQSLKDLAEKFPAYTETLKKIWHQFREKLQFNVQEAEEYFYYDLMYHLLLLSGNKITVEELIKDLSFYESLIAVDLYDEILNLLKNFNPVFKHDSTQYPFTWINNRDMQYLINQVNHVFGIKDDSFMLRVFEAINGGWAIAEKSAKYEMEYAKKSPATIITTLFSNSHSNKKITSMSLGILINLLYFMPLARAQSNGMNTYFLKTFNTNATTTVYGGSVTFNNSVMFTGFTRGFGATADDLLAVKFNDALEPEWEFIVRGSAYEAGYAIYQNSNNNIFITGYTGSDTIGAEDFLMIKAFSNGTLQSVYTVGGLQHDFALAMCEATDGNTVVAGYTANLTTGNEDIVLAKINNNDALQWSISLSTNASERVEKIYKQNDGGVIFVGYTRTPVGGPPQEQNIVLGNIASNSALNWTMQIDINAYDEGVSFFEDVDASNIIVGNTGSFNGTTQDMFIAKIYSNRTLAWAYRFGGSDLDHAVDAFKNNDGNIVLTGFTYSFNSIEADILVAEVNNNGTLGQAYVVRGNGDDIATAIFPNINGGSLLIGHTTSFLNISTNYAPLLASIDENGNIPGCNNFIPVQLNWLPLNLTISNFSVTYQSAGFSTRAWATYTFRTVNLNETTICLTTVPITTGIATTNMATTDVVTTGVFTTTSTTNNAVTTGFVTTNAIGTTNQNVITTDSVSTSVTTNAASLLSSNSSFPEANNTALIIGISVGSLVFVICLGGTTFLLCRRRKNAAKEKEVELQEPTPHLLQQEAAKHISIKRAEETIKDYVLVKKVTREEARELTKQVGEGIKINFRKKESKRGKPELPKGRFGKLRLARDKDGKYVGVKIINGKREMLDSKNEAALQTELNKNKCPYVMPILDFVEGEEVIDGKVHVAFYQFMPLASFGNGKELQAVLAKAKSIYPELSLRFLAHVAKCLLTGFAGTHKLNIYHLDMKPTNFVMDHEGNPLIIDFGCAVKSEKRAIPHKQADIWYFSPERLASLRFALKEKNKDKTQELAKEIAPTFDAEQADAWALGITLFELLFNKYPFDNQANHATKLASWDSQYFTKKLAEIPELQNPAKDSIFALIKGLLESDPRKRLSAAQALKHSFFQSSQFRFNSIDEQAQALVTLRNAPEVQVTSEHTSFVEEKSKEEDENYAVFKIDESQYNLSPQKVYQTPMVKQTYFSAKTGSKENASGEDLYDIKPVQSPELSKGTK